ncbi:uncharacterized protein LOC143051149 [Mytilus galloprovincialis]|uniref:uncharacterized protein LOC143051149 n=1 Tax=Mytilus galloprovincialis TaxID=29158 RepID=UPI003F7BFCB6
MACLYRILMAKLRHSTKLKQSTKATIDRYCDRVSAFYISLQIPVLFWSQDNKVNLMPVADKYLLVGDDTMVQNVKAHIFAEFEKSTFRNMWYGRRSITIDIIKETKQYEALKDNNQKIGLLVCIPSQDDLSKAKYCLPEKLPSNIKCKSLLVEKQGGVDSVVENINRCTEKNPNIKHLFKGSDIKTLSPVPPTVYVNTKMDESTKQFLYFVFAICVSVYSMKR